MSTKWNTKWPVIRTYEGTNLRRIAMPLGGIGTGTVALGGRGDLRDWEVVNRPAKWYIPRMDANARAPGPSFVIRAKAPGEEPVSRLLEGPLDTIEYEGGSGSPSHSHGLPRFRDCRFAVAYPLAQVHLRDKAVPVSVRLEAFNPLIPGDADRSGVPVAVLRYVVTNTSAAKLKLSLCGSLPNFIGIDGSQTSADWSGAQLPTGARNNRNRWRETSALNGLAMESEGVPKDHPAWGTLALTTTTRRGLSHRTAWAQRSWGDSLLDFWDDFTGDGALDDREVGKVERPMGSLCVSFSLAPGKSREVVFLLAWHFPNRQTWTPAKAPEGDCGCSDGSCKPPDNRIGNYYTTQYRDAWAAAEYAAANLPALERDTVRFVNAFCAADLPEVVKEAALFNLSTLRSQTCFRTPDGHFYGWEGCHDCAGCCHGSCTHVWNYEQATAFLFGELSRSMRTVEFAHSVNKAGLMSFRVALPIERGCESGLAAADGQMGCLMKLYRDWQLSGDDRFLKKLWPHAKRSLEFCWLPGSWDADRDGIMEGCQHNTMDVEYFGPNPQMQGWYLGALRAAEEMAAYLGDKAFAATCRELFEAGSAYMDETLFNGDYYEHIIQPPKEPIYKGLQIGMGAGDLNNPHLQLGSGCLVDQLVGQYMANVCGLGYLHDPRHVRRTLRSIMDYNFKQGFHDHFNHLRGYALGDESALLMASYPKGRRPERPFPYYNEVMTGFEYTAGVHMLYEGQLKRGLKVIAAIRERYDGYKRNPFDEAECGHHYARAMASWAAVLALSGFHYSAVSGAMAFAAGKGRWFWSTGDAWGTCRVQPGKRVELVVEMGQVTIRELKLGDKVVKTWSKPQKVGSGQTLRVNL